MLSNVELAGLLTGLDPIVIGVEGTELPRTSHSAIQPASLDLHIGEILVPTGESHLAPLDRPKLKYVIPSGGSAVVLTRERINLTANYSGVMFPKSSKLAERGILLTNCGHVDPGYVGQLRYAVINLGREDFEIRIGDPIASLCLFRLAEAAKPDWLATRLDPDRELKDRVRTEDFTRALSPRFLASDHAEKLARRTATDVVNSHSIWATVVACVVSIVIGVLSAGITFGLAWTSFAQPQIAELRGKLEQLQNDVSAQDSGVSPARTLSRPEPSQHERLQVRASQTH